MAGEFEEKSRLLASSCQEAFQAFPKSCSHSVWYVIRKYRPKQDYMAANVLIDYLSNNPDWQQVKDTEVTELASDGTVVVGGLKGDRHGHVVIVYPGPRKARGGYFYKHPRTGRMTMMPENGAYPRVMSTSIGEFPGAMSNGDKTAWDPWGSDKRYKKVRFWKYTGPVRMLTTSRPSINTRWDVEKVATTGPQHTAQQAKNPSSERRWRMEAETYRTGMDRPEDITRWQR